MASSQCRPKVPFVARLCLPQYTKVEKGRVLLENLSLLEFTFLELEGVGYTGFSDGDSGLRFLGVPASSFFQGCLSNSEFRLLCCFLLSLSFLLHRILKSSVKLHF